MPDLQLTIKEHDSVENISQSASWPFCMSLPSWPNKRVQETSKGMREHPIDKKNVQSIQGHIEAGDAWKLEQRVLRCPVQQLLLHSPGRPAYVVGPELLPGPVWLNTAAVVKPAPLCRRPVGKSQHVDKEVQVPQYRPEAHPFPAWQQRGACQPVFRTAIWPGIAIRVFGWV